ncbi:MAG: hypothetical protein A3B31_02380 [Candidatus Komeilibacteria bacterium RIFCSPLOWO2_01_FULL_53_11]|uniref:Uncharacterized protein n=1 Tax=Candidatus Komeilibacteria bacterium RIFCSPLOWO2_01_FULL_53_11 TaxID=1798552 RepID=A0A1G2BU54_9BACT|nr:MAG: hypothetical protein A3B31_02380 [Candidatus Komeilibacteria bacterium RIFCSPLOWO2_01_FULL_53_11]
MFSREIIDKLQAVRRATFRQYDDVTLDRGALTIFARLFVNPDCRSDIDFFSIDKNNEKLSELGEHIVTAGPSTVAQYAERHGRMHITEQDLLRCFALDHAADVMHNHVADEKNPLYAFAHILHLSRVLALREIEEHTVADVRTKTPWGTVTFRNLVVPKGLSVEKGNYVYHHFGVVIAKADDATLAQSIVDLQGKNPYMTSLQRAGGRKRISVDFGDAGVFRKDVLGMMLKPLTITPFKKAQDLHGGKIKFQN